jgi:ribosomal-protein-serine acetyltransferase
LEARHSGQLRRRILAQCLLNPGDWRPVAPSPPNILVATLCYGALLSHEYAHSLLKLMSSPGQLQASVGLLTSAPSPHAPGARNALMKRFLDVQSATHLLFIDSDVGFEPASVRRLLAFDEEVVAGACAAEGEDPPNGGRIDGAREVRGDFVTAEYAEARFMMIKRSAVERLVSGLSVKESPAQGVFDWMVEPTTGQYLSEDFAFCHRFRSVGGKVWLDTQSQLRGARSVLPDPLPSGMVIPTRAEARTHDLRSSRLVLAPVEPRDTMDLWAAIDASRSELEAWLPSASLITDREAVHRHTVSSVDDWDHGRACRFTIRDSGTHAFLGVVSVEDFNLLRQSVELGYWLRSDATGSGVATEACSMVLSWLFTRVNVRRVRAAVATENRASLAVVRRLGFRFEGTARRVEQCQGRWLDHAMFALLDTDARPELGLRPAAGAGSKVLVGGTEVHA